jgi:hypothetical protein
MLLEGRERLIAVLALGGVNIDRKRGTITIPARKRSRASRTTGTNGRIIIGSITVRSIMAGTSMSTVSVCR